MKPVLFFLIGLICSVANAQTTPNPKVARKSATDIFINKIELTDDYTIVSMQFVAKTEKEKLQEYFDQNPELYEQLKNSDPLTRMLYLRSLKEGTNDISFQKTAFLRANDGKKFNFIKASNIPISPQKRTVTPGEKYFFKVYFKRLDPGIETIDLIENAKDKIESMSYWNFYGVSVNNPPLNAAPKENEPEPVLTSESMVLKGKVFDAVTNQPIPAKIRCVLSSNESVIDSLQTSRSGNYEFLLPTGDYKYILESEGYLPLEQNMKLEGTTEKKFDFYLEPLLEEKQEDISAENEAEETVTEPELEKVAENTFRLENVYFPTGEATILNNSYDELDRLVNYLKEHPKQRIRIEGHTDNQGDARLNKILSLDRAKAVRDYLIKQGIALERLEYTGFGDTKPLNTNNSETERRKNRRVEIVLID